MYYLLFISAVLGFIINERTKKDFSFEIVASILFVIIFIRFGAGADYFSYEFLYNNIDTTDVIGSYQSIPNMEPLFKIIMIVFRIVKIPYHFFTAIVSTLITFFFIKFIKKHSPNCTLSLLSYISMFFLVWSLSALRQGLVISLLLNIYFDNDKFSLLDQVIASIVLSFIHFSALIALGMFLLSQIKMPKKNYLFIAILALSFQLIPPHYYIRVIENIKYLNKIFYYIDEQPISLLSLTMLVRIFFFAIIYFYYDSLVLKYQNAVMLNFILINYIVYFLLSFSSLTAARISIYGYMCFIVIVPMIISLYDNTNLYNFGLIIVLFFSLLSFGKEMETMVVQTGYTGSQLQINKEMIFNKSRKKFSNIYNFDTLNSEIGKEFSKEFFAKKPQNLESESNYSNSNTHISVKFIENDLYGIINDKGEVVEGPHSLVRFNIIGPYAETVYNPYDFKTSIYRKIGTKENLSYHETIKIKEEDVLESVRFDVHWYEEEKYDLKKLGEQASLAEYNLSVPNDSYLYRTSYHEDINYLKVNTRLATYYAILNEDEIISKLLYKKISPYNKDGIMKGYINDEIHYLNKSGEVIWIEKTD